MCACNFFFLKLTFENPEIMYYILYSFPCLYFSWEHFGTFCAFCTFVVLRIGKKPETITFVSDLHFEKDKRVGM